MKKVIILNESAGIKFGIGDRDITINEGMSVADAETIKKQYPGVYVDVVDATETDKITKSAK